MASLRAYHALPTTVGHLRESTVTLPRIALGDQPPPRHSPHAVDRGEHGAHLFDQAGKDAFPTRQGQSRRSFPLSQTWPYWGAAWQPPLDGPRYRWVPVLSAPCMLVVSTPGCMRVLSIPCMPVLSMPW